MIRFGGTFAATGLLTLTVNFSVQSGNRSALWCKKLISSAFQRAKFLRLSAGEIRASPSSWTNASGLQSRRTALHPPKKNLSAGCTGRVDTRRSEKLCSASSGAPPLPNCFPVAGTFGEGAARRIPRSGERDLRSQTRELSPSLGSAQGPRPTPVEVAPPSPSHPPSEFEAPTTYAVD